MTGKSFYTEGMLLLDQGKFEPALQLFNKALELDPDQPDFLSDRAVAYFHLEKKDLAIIDLNRAQQLDPENPYRYSSRAFVKDSLGDIDGAISDYEKATSLDPKDAVAWNNLGLLEEKKGYLKKAQSHFNKADELIQKNTNEESGKEKFIPMSEIKKELPETSDGNKIKKTNTDSAWQHVKYAVFTRTGRKEFFSFIKNGLRIK